MIKLKRTGKLTGVGTQVSSSEDGKVSFSTMFIEIDGIRIDVTNDKIVTVEVE